ncbi:MAG: hypothetical protein ACI4EO_08330 [Blautia sp.]
MYIAEEIGRLRAGKVEKIPGFDGEYGRIQVLNIQIEKQKG